MCLLTNHESYVLGHCTLPMVNSGVVIEGYINGQEGSQITVHCREQSKSIVSTSTCVSGGIWSPDLAKHMMMCKGMTLAY